MDRAKPTLDEFLAHFVGQLEESPDLPVEAGTEFRRLPDWSSMQSLIMIASFDWEYGVTMTAEELKGAVRVGDLYEIVKGKMN